MAAKERFPWVAVSAVVAMILTAAVAMLPPPDEGQRMAAGGNLPKLGLTRISQGNATELLTEQIVAYDPAPLFIPSAMNSSETTAHWNSPGTLGPFAELPWRFSRSASLAFPSRVKIPSGPVEELKRTENHNSLLAFDRADRVNASTGTAAARVEVLKAGSGDLVLGVVLPTEGALASGDWQPLELMGVVTRAGLVGELVVTESSGSIEIDDNFRSLLRKNMQLLNRLPVGFYNFRVGR